MQVMYSDVEELFEELVRSENLVYPRTQPDERRGYGPSIIRITDFVERKSHQAGYILTYWVLVTFRVLDEIHFAKIRIGRVDWWGKEFHEQETRRKELIEATKQCVDNLTVRLDQDMGFEVRSGQYVIDLDPSRIVPADWRA